MSEAHGRAPTLGRRVVSGGLWLLGSHTVAMVTSFTGTLVLAALLVPADFGVFTAAFFAVSAVTVGLSFGLSELILVSPPERDPASLAFALVVGVSSAVLLAALAPTVAGLLGEPAATPLIWGLVPVVIARRWAEVRQGILERELRFRRTGSVRILGAVLGTGVAIGLGMLRRDAWALVSQVVIMEVVPALLLTIGGTGAKRPIFSIRGLRSVARSGREFLGNSLVVFAYNNLDDAAVVRLLGSTALGLYSFAYQLSNAPTYVFTRAASRVLLPALRTSRLRGGGWEGIYLPAVRVLAAITGTIMFAFAIHGPAVLDVLYRGRWSGAYDVIRVLAAYGLFRSVASTSGTVFIASGDPGLVRRIAQWQTLVMLILLVPALELGGVTGAAVAVTGPLVGAAFYALLRSARLVGLRPSVLFFNVLTIWAVAAGVNAIGIPIRSAFQGLGGLALTFGFVAITGMAAGYLLLGRESELLWRYARQRGGSDQETTR